MSKKNNGTCAKTSDICDLFTIVRPSIDCETFEIAIGNRLLTQKKFKSWEDAEKYIASKPYDFLIQLFLTILNFKENEKGNENPTN